MNNIAFVVIAVERYTLTQDSCKGESLESALKMYVI